MYHTIPQAASLEPQTESRLGSGHLNLVNKPPLTLPCPPSTCSPLPFHPVLFVKLLDFSSSTAYYLVSGGNDERCKSGNKATQGKARQGKARNAPQAGRLDKTTDRPQTDHRQGWVCFICTKPFAATRLFYSGLLIHVASSNLTCTRRFWSGGARHLRHITRITPRATRY